MNASHPLNPDADSNEPRDPGDCVVFRIADYGCPRDADAVIRGLDAYARDPMGGGAGLSEYTKANLAGELARLPHAFTLLMERSGELLGLANCFEGFSTFACRKLVNLHDVVILEPWRGRGLSRLLLQAVADEACRRGCCKLTLEVLEGNAGARRAYERFGFKSYELLPTTGRALFLECPLPAPDLL
jgi:GNAT superfamily N-acetyltransferase